MKHKNGLTLFELLVAILIISILTAFIYPKYKFATQRAKLAKAFSKASEINKAMDAYYVLPNVKTSASKRQTPKVVNIEFRKENDYRYSAKENGYLISAQITPQTKSWNNQVMGRHLNLVMTKDGNKVCLPHWDGHADKAGLKLCKYMEKHFGFKVIDSKPQVTPPGSSAK